ncbi:ATP-binding cassette sub-family A member 13 [Macrotis lagotis]|uniref:ATP-binding cassette sub-family A member 13 n=1 Tax=Macrotis lagotis TaxID=92651 RepID=UPI003D6961BE
MGGQSLHQFQALFWKNWLCRLRQPVLSLAEFLWPCTLFLILTVLRFQEPPRHRDNCYLQPRNLPSQGVYPFVQSLLCNAGSRCKNTSYAVPKEPHFRISRSPNSQDHQGMGTDLVFLENIQELAEGISETMEKAFALQKLWMESSKFSGSPNSAFSLVDLNKTETLISKIENLHHQPYFWNFLHSLPGLQTNKLHPEYGLQVLAQFLQTILSSLASLEDLDWLPINRTFSKAAQIGLNVTINILEFLQEEKVDIIGLGYNLSLRNMVWNPQKLKSDLTSKYGFDDLRVEKMLNYTGELNEIPTDSSLEQFICAALFNTSEVEDDNNYNLGNCSIQWSEAKDYLIHSVSWLQIYKQMIQQWLNGSVVQKILTGMEQSLEVFIDQYSEDSESWKVPSVLNIIIHLLDDNFGADSLPNYLLSPKTLVDLAKFQTILQNLPHWPTVKRLLLVNGALRNVIIKNLHFIREVLSKLERLAPFSETDDLSSLQLEMDMFFRDLKQNESGAQSSPDRSAAAVQGTRSRSREPLYSCCQRSAHRCSDWGPNLRYCSLLLSYHPECCDTKTLLLLPVPSPTSDFIVVLCLGTKSCNPPLSSVLSHGGPGALTWWACAHSLSSPTATLHHVSLPGLDIQREIFHTLEEVQFALEQNSPWKNLTDFLRKTCEVAHYVNKQENFQRSAPVTSEKSPCEGAKLDWKVITDTYFMFLKNLLKSPRISVSRILVYTKYLLEMEKKSHSYEDEATSFWLSFVDFLEKMVLTGSLVSSNHSAFQNLANLTEIIWNKTLWGMNTSRSSGAEPYSLNSQEFSKFSKEVIEKIQVVSSLWKRHENEGFLRILELLLYEIHPKLLELWMYGIPKREKDTLETLSTLLNLSIPENQRVFGKNLNFSLNFQSLSENLNLDFVHLSEIVINSLYELGLIKQEQVTAALNTVHALRNLSMLSSSFSDSQKQYLENILTQIYQNVFQDKNSVELFRLYSSIYQDIYQFISSFQNEESLLTFFIQISESLSAIIKKFNFQDISKAFEFLSEVTHFLNRISEESLCKKLFSVYNYLGHQVKSLIPKESQEARMIHTTLMSFKQVLIRDKNFRRALLYYLNQLFNNSVEGHLTNQCFYLDDRVLSLNRSMNVRNSLILPWIQMLSENIVINESLAMQCAFSWVEVWYEIWSEMSQVLKFDSRFFLSLQIGLRKLSSELGNSFEHSEACQTMFPDHIPIKLIRSILKNIVHNDDARNWNDLIGLSSVLDNSLAIIKSLTTEKVEKSLLTLENELLKLKESPLNINISRKIFYTLFEVFMELSNATGNIDRDSIIGSGEDYETAFSILQETIRFLRNISYNQDLLSCAGILPNITNLIMESDLASKNTSQKLLSVLTILNSILTSEDKISRLEGCTAWIDIIRNLGFKYNTSFHHSQDFLQVFLSSRNVNDTKITIRKMLDFVSFILSSTKTSCSLNNSDMHCLDVYFRNVTNFVKAVITPLLEKEKMPMSDFILRILNNSEDQIRIIINNLTRMLEFSPDINWKNFTELIIRALENSENSPNRFQIVWRQSIAFFREIQKLVENIIIKFLENNPSDNGKLLKLFTNFPKEKSTNLLGESIQNLGSYFAFNLSHDLQNSPIHAIMKAIDLDIQLARDVMNSLLPSILPNIPQNSGNMKVLKKISTLIHNLKNTDVELLVDQLEQISGSLWSFLKNISALEDGNLGIDLLIGLMNTFVHSSHSWNVNHLLQLSRLFPKDEVDAVVDAYYVLPDGVRLLQSIAHKNISEALLEVYNFTLVHGVSISTITKEDFASAIKSLLDITELVIEKPNIAAEALSCHPVTWCSNHTTLQLHNDIVIEKCKTHKSMHPLLYSKMADLFYHLHLMPLEEDLQCSNETLRIEVTHRVYCFFHELAAWNSILLNFSEVFQVNNSLLKELQGLWYKTSPYILSSEKSSNTNESLHCMVIPGKWIALRVIEKLKKMNFTKVLSVKDILEQLTGRKKIQYWNVDKETSVLNKSVTNLKRWINLVSNFDVENQTFFLSPSMHVSSKAKCMNYLLKVLVSFDKTSNIIDNLENLWLESYPEKNFGIEHIFSSVKQGIQIMKSLVDQNTTLPLSYLLKQFNPSFLHWARFLEDLKLVTRDLLYKYRNGNFSAIIDTLIPALINESSPFARTLNNDDITDFMEHFKNVSREGNINITFVAHLLNLEKQANFSVAQFLFESSLISAINNFAWSSFETALHLNDTDLPIMDFIDLVFNYTQFEYIKGNISLHQRSTMELFKQFSPKFFPPKGNFESTLYALLKNLCTHMMAKMSNGTKDKLLNLLKLDPFTNLKEEGGLLSNSSSLRENIYDLIKDSLKLEDGKFYFDTLQGLKFIRDLLHVILRDIPTRNDTGNDAKLVKNKTYLLSKMNSFEDLVKFSEDLDSAVQLVRKNSAKIVSLMDIIFSYRIKDLHNFSSTLQVVLANLTELVTFVDNIFPSKERKVVEITKQLLDIIAYGEKDIPEVFLEMSQALSTLLQDIKKLRDLSQAVDTMVEFLNLSKKVSAQVATILESHLISKTSGKLNSLEILYSFLQEAVHSAVDEITSMRNTEVLRYQEVERLLKPLLDVTAWTVEIKPTVFKESKPLNKSYLSQSKNISEIVEEIALFIINSKNHSIELEHLVSALKNASQTLSIEAKTLMEEVLDFLVPINNLTRQVNFLNSNLNSSYHWLWDTKWEGLHKMILFWNEILSQTNPESGAKLKMMIALSLEALGNNLQKGDWDIFNLLLTFAQHPNNLSQAIESTRKMLSVSGGEFSKALFFNSSTIPNMTHQELEKAIQVALNKIALWMDWLLLHHSQWRHSTKALFPLTWETSVNATTGKGVMSKPPNNIKRERNNFLFTFKSSSCFEKSIKRIIYLAKYWQKGPLQNQSVLEMCQFFQKLLKPSTALTLQKVKMTVLNVLTILAVPTATIVTTTKISSFIVTIISSSTTTISTTLFSISRSTTSTITSSTTVARTTSIVATISSKSIISTISTSITVSAATTTFTITTSSTKVSSTVKVSSTTSKVSSLTHKIARATSTTSLLCFSLQANYTFVFVDKLRIVFEEMLKMSSVFQNDGNAQMINQLQEALKNTFIKNFVESQLQIDVEKLIKKLQNYAEMLGKMFNHSKTEQFHSLAQIMMNISSCVLLNRFQPLESVEILEREAHGLMQQNNLLASIIFNSSLNNKRHGPDFVDLPHHFIYTIRTSVLYSMRTDLVKNPLWKFHPQSLPADGFKYNHIFVPLQDMIERAIILVQTGLDTLTSPIQAQAMPYPCHTSDLFLNNVGFFFPLIMMLTWMVSVASMVRKLVYEREIRLEEYMRMMGVHPTVNFLAWFLENIIMIIISSCALAIILKTSGIFTHSNAFIIFLFLLDFGVSVIMLSFLLSAFFSSANTAALCTSLVYMITFLPYIVLLVLHNQLSFAIQTVLCFLSTTAFGQGVFFITFLEGQEAGIQWNNMYQSLEQEGGMTFGWVCWMILFDSVAYFICGWYFSNLIPGNFGLKKPWNFPFTMSYWQNLCHFKMRKQHITSNLLFFNENFMNKGSLPPNRQKTIEDGVHTGVTLVSVTKEYQGDKKAAVKELTLTFYKGQITALLGPNGAGKTTIISLLTGLYPPSSGTIIINGKDMQTQLAAIRMEMGVCPQHDVLFDNLSVWEHLLLFATIKAPLWTKKQLYQQVNKTLEDVELTHHQHKHIRSLSGGMKRKLSIGIAIIGNSNVVVLDEPTSGVDPCARRSIWDILLKYRAGRTLIFTTHHLDEAEVLSDRIAILQNGQLRCSGSPSSLKETYGHGFSLTLTKQPFILEIQDAKVIDRVTSLIQIYIPQAFLKENDGNELTYAIPKDTDKACFKGLFQALDQNLHDLHLTGYGISDTTLEEVFLKLLHDSKNKSHIPDTIDTESQYERSMERLHDNSNSHGRIKPNQGGKLLLTQMAALLLKKFHHTRRGWKGTLSDLVLPVLFVALAMGLFMVKPLVIEYPSLKLTPGHYDSEETYFFSTESEDTSLPSVLLRSFSVQDPLCSNFKPDLKNFSCWRSDPFPLREFSDSCGCLKCPKENTSAPYLKNSKGHTLLNLTAFDVEEYLLWPSKKPRLGGWSFGVKIPNQGQDSNVNMSKPQTLAKVWYNQKGFHALPSYLNHLNNLILWQHLPPSVNWRQYGITLYSHPYGGALLNEDKILESVRQCGVALCIMLGFSILTASIGSSVVKDRVCGAKRLQHISGLGYRTYWFTNFIYDMLFYLVSVSLSIGVIVAFQLTAFTFRENLAATALLLAFFGYATLPWMYLLSRLFSSSDVAFISYISLNFIFGLCTMLMTIMPRLLAVISKAQNLQNIYNVLKWVFTIFPQFCLGQGLIELCYNQIKFDLTHNFGIDSYVSPFEMNFLGWIFVAMTLQGTTFLLLRILLHWDLLQKLRNYPVILGLVSPSEDIDVKEEQMRIWTGRTDSDILVLRNLRKSYQGFGKRSTAVNDISLGIPRGECFGLLGVNGAGKSTTFKMLTGDITPSSGYAAIRNPGGDEMVLSSSGAAGILIGYCPQKDALDEFLTGWEHLHYYCSLRGVPKQDIQRVARELVHRLHLEAHIGKPVNTYSGGTKRKLSTALALVGKPEILLLDEPSSGMDPGSKRYLWKTIMKEVQEGCAAVLTSHSMEECEALCSRLAIMVNGSFKCLGSPQHIKNRFGAGYTVKVWLSQETKQHNAISDCLNLHFPGIQFKGQHLNLLEYRVPQRWGCLADLFKVLENNKTLLNIKHYSINQTTLEQVFISFATQQQQTPFPTFESSTNYIHPHLVSM